MGRLVRCPRPGTLQMIIATGSWIALIRRAVDVRQCRARWIHHRHRVIIFALLPSWGVSNAAATMVGQALGARKPERAEHAVKIAGFYNMAFLGGVGLVFVLLARQIIGLFTHDRR
jgi:hypothetical protein